MATTIVDQITGGGETVAYKAPCRLATTANIVLSGLQTVDGSMTVASDRVFVRVQTDAKQNGVYIASAGTWQRARDFDSNRDVTKGTRLTVTDGATLGGREYVLTSANPVVVGTSNITFAESLSSDSGGNAASAAASAEDAEEAASAARNSIAALLYTFASATADADPGAGLFRLNNANPASATALYIDNVDADGLTMSSVIDTWDDSTNTVRGQLTIRSVADATIRRVYNVTGSVVDGTGYRKLTLAYVGGAGTLAGPCFLIFSATGSAGSVSGPASSVVGRVATFANTGGNSIQDSGVALAALALLASPAFTGTVSITNTAAGTILTLRSTDSGAGGGPDLVLDRATLTAAINDLLADIVWNGRDSAGNDHVYARIVAQILDPTNGSEDGALIFDVAVNGAASGRMTLAQGLAMAGVTGSDKGPGSVNGYLYDDGYRLADVVLTSGTLSAVAALTINLSTYVAAGFTEFGLRLNNLVPATDNVTLSLTLSTNAGSSFISSGYKYSYGYALNATTGGVGNNSTTAIQVVSGSGNSANEYNSMSIDIMTGPTRCAVITDVMQVSQTGDMVTVRGNGDLNSANVNALRLAFSSGNISSGTWTLIGKRGS